MEPEISAVPWAGGRARRILFFRVVLVMTVLVASGCATRNWNQPIDQLDAGAAYDFRTRLPANADDVFVILAFSGGGTRSAAFAYGILEKFRDTRIIIGGQQRRLLDEVDVITAVSGGSFTAAYYGLFGDRVFTDFKTRFLLRNTQSELLHLLFNPLNLSRIASSKFNRSDLAARWFDRELFENKTFDDLSLGALPFVIINASDLNNGATFSFIQQQFDFLCSSLSGYPVANAVAASSAVPAAFATIAVRNYEDCPQRHIGWVDQALAEDNQLERRYAVARSLERYRVPNHLPVVQLVDGGVTDNLGVRGSMMSPVAHYGNVPDMAGAFTEQQLARVRQVLVVVANAQVYSEFDWSRRGQEPGIFDSVRASFYAALGILNTETASLAKQGFEMWGQRINATRGASTPPVKVYFSVLTFNHIADRAEREYFESLPTTFHLKSQDVEAVSGLAGRLLDESPEFTEFVRTVQ
jgi:NTE family protein